MNLDFDKYFCISTNDIKKLLADELNKFYTNVVFTNDYIYARGELPVCLVAHMDIVGNKSPDKLIIKDGIVRADNRILGADDRAGILGIMELLKMGYRPSVIFCDEEEIGCVGARKFTNAFESIDNVKLFVELDKSGKMLYTQYDCDNKDLHDYLATIGLKNTYGAFSDISTICPHFGIAGINIGIGYYNQHSNSEYLVINELIDAINVTKKILDDAHKLPKYAYVETPKWAGKYSGGYDWYDDKYAYAYDDTDLFDNKIEFGGTIVGDFDCLDAEEAFFNVSADITKIASNYGLSDEIAYMLDDADVKDILSEIETIIANKLIDKAFEKSIKKDKKKKKAI